MLTAAGDVNKPPGETALRHNMSSTGMISTERRTPRLALEGTGLCLPLGNNELAVKGPIKKLPRRSCSHSGVMTTRRISGGTVNLGKLAESLTFNNNGASGKIKSSSNDSVSADSINKGNERRSRRTKMPYNKLKECEVDMSASSTSITSATTRSSTTSSQSRYQRSSSLDLRPSSAIRAMDESASSVSSKSGYQRSSSMDLRSNPMDASSATWGPTTANASISTGLDASAATWTCAPSRVPRSFRRNLTGGGANKTPTKSSVKICGPAVTPGLKRSNPTTSTFSDAVRRTKSSNLDEMRASIRLGDPYSLKGKLEKELKLRKSSSPLDDLASVVSASENSDKPKENKAVEEKEEKLAFREERGKEENSDTPPTPKVQRSFSGPLEASSSHTNNDFFRQFDASVAFNDDGFAFAPGLKRHQSAPLAEFDSFPDAFVMGETDAADWNPAPALSREASDEAEAQDEKEDEQVAKALMALANARKPRQVRRVSSSTNKDMEAASQKARASIQEKRKNAASAASTSLSAAADRVRSLTPEKREMETMVSTKERLLSAAERAKARAKERKQIRSTSPMARTQLLTAARRARTRVQVRKAAEESKSRLRSRSPMRKMRSASANRRPLTNSLVDLGDSNEKEDKDHTRRRGSAASWHELVCADIDEDVGSVMTSQSCNMLSVSTASPRTCRSSSPRRLRRVNSNPRAVASCILDEDMSIDEDTQKSQVDPQEIGTENPGVGESNCEHQLGAFLSAEAKGKEANGCINASEHTVGTQAFSKGMQKIRNLMSTSPLRSRQSSAVDSTIEDKADPRARRTSLQIFKEFVQPKKSAEASPKAINADAFASEPSSQQQQDDNPSEKDMGNSALGESSAPLEAEVKSKAHRHSTEGQQRRKRVSKSRSHAGPRSSGDREKMDRNSRRKASTSGTVREKSSRRKSADRVKAHNSLSVINTTDADLTKGGNRKHDKPRTGSRRKSSSSSKTDGKRRKSGSEKRKSAESRRLKSHIMHENRLNKSESEMSIGLSELDMSESGHESKSTYTNGSSATGSMSSSSKGRNKSSSSSRSFGLDDSKSRELNSRSQGDVKKQANEAGTLSKKSLPERKSLCQSLQLDTVPETYNEDEQSEAPRSPSKRKGRSPSASSSIQSTAELSNSEEERANDVDPNENRRRRPSGGFVAHGSYHPGAPGGTSSLAADELERRWREFAQLGMSSSSDPSMYCPDPRHAWAGRLAMMQMRYPGGHYPVDGRPPPHDGAPPGGSHWPLGPNPSLYPPVGPGWRGPRGLGHGTEHDALRNGQRNASQSSGVAKETIGGKSTEKEGSTRGSLRRRHSIGSGHGRDAIMHEVTTAMERELRNPACFRCHEPIGQCRCAEPVVDISRHSRESVPMPEEVPGKLPRRSSLRDTFGIVRSETSADSPSVPPSNAERESRDGTVDVDLHVGNPYYFFGPPRPLYDRPATWDLNDYVPASNPGGRLAATRNPNVHRGRSFGGVPDSDNRSNRGHRGMRSFAVDDDSIRYPRRSCIEGSTSGRSMVSSDEGSGRSFF